MGILESTLANSSAIADFNYVIELLQLEITFREGGTYTYHNVDPFTYEDFLASPSKGRFFNANIRNNFTVTRG